MKENKDTVINDLILQVVENAKEYESNAKEYEEALDILSQRIEWLENEVDMLRIQILRAKNIREKEINK